MKTTKNNSMMAYITLEDDTGSMELLTFSNALTQYGNLLYENSAVVVSGRISVRDEKEPQLMVDSIRPISDAAAMASEGGRKRPALSAAEGQKLYAKVPARECAEMKHIALVLKMFPGSGELIIWCERERKRIGAQCLINETLIDEMRDTVGEENVVLK